MQSKFLLSYNKPVVRGAYRINVTLSANKNKNYIKIKTCIFLVFLYFRNFRNIRLFLILRLHKHSIGLDFVVHDVKVCKILFLFINSLLHQIHIYNNNFVVREKHTFAGYTTYFFSNFWTIARLHI